MSLFALESEMKAPVIQWMTDQGMYVAEEFGNGWAICDLVGCKFDADKIRVRTQAKQRQPLGSSTAIHIYNKLPQHKNTLINDLSPYINAEEIETALDKLIKNNHVIVTKSGVYQKVNGWDPMYSRLIAIELKLHRISDVIAQAESNRGFVPESYIALPQDLAERNLKKDTFVTRLNNAGIGLIAVTPTSSEVLLQPRHLPNHTYIYVNHEMWTTEYFWRKHRGKHKSRI